MALDCMNHVIWFNKFNKFNIRTCTIAALLSYAAARGLAESPSTLLRGCVQCDKVSKKMSSSSNLVNSKIRSIFSLSCWNAGEWAGKEWTRPKWRIINLEGLKGSHCCCETGASYKPRV